MPEAQVVNCNSCGASLPIEEETRFVTCRHCGSSLEVRRNDHAFYTTAIEQLQQDSFELQSRMRHLELTRQLDALDAEWRADRRNFITIDKEGREVEPTRTAGLSSLLNLLFACGFGSAMYFGRPEIKGLDKTTGPAIVYFFVAFYALSSLASLVRARRAYRQYVQIRTRYQQRRRVIREQIDALGLEAPFCVDDEAAQSQATV